MKKKLLSISLLCLFGMIVASCGGKQSSPDTNSVSEPPSAVSSDSAGKSESEPGSSVAPSESSVAPSSSSVAPSSSSEAPVTPTGISLDKQNAEIIKGQTLQLNATLAPAGAQGEVTWSSEDEDVVTVSRSGLVTAVEVGTAKVAAKIKNTNLKAECVVTVIKEINSIQIKNKSAFDGFIVDDSESLTIEIDPADNATALMTAGALKVTSSDQEVATVSGLTVTALKAGKSTITASLFGKTDSFELNVADAIPGIPYSVLGALDKGIQEAPFNGKSGKESAITTTCFELTGKILAVSPNGETGFNAILADDTQAVMLQVSKLAEEQIPVVAGDYAKVTCKFTNYYGLLEGVSRKAATGSSAAYIPSKDFEKIDAPETPFTPFLNEPEAMTNEQYAAYYQLCKDNGTKDKVGATWTSLKYVTLDAEYSESLHADDKGDYKIAGNYGLTAYNSIELDKPFDGQKCTFDVFLLGANTSKSKSNGMPTKQTPLAPTAVALDQEAQVLVHGNTLQMSYTTTPAGSYSRQVAWTSSDPTAATIDENGALLGVYEGEGSKPTNVKVTLGEGDGAVVSPEVTINIFGETVPVTAVSLDKTSASVIIGKTLQLTATPTPAMNSDKAVWSSDNESVAKVDQKGLVSALAVGNANITVRYNETAFASCAITVTEDTRWNTEFSTTKVANIELPDSGDTADKYYVVCEITAISSTRYGNGNAVDKDGTEFAIYGMYNYNGKTRYDSMSAEEKPVVGDVVVLYGVFTKYNNAPEIKNAWVVQRNSAVFQAPALTEITLNKESLSLEEGETATLTASPTPSDAELGTIVWSSSDESIATVNQEGLVTAVAAGSATITATSGSLSASCAVTVTAAGSSQTELVSVAKYTITNTKNSTAETDGSVIKGWFTKQSGDDIVSSCESPSYIYPGANGGNGDTAWEAGNFLKIGKASAGGALTINLSKSVSKMVIKGYAWKNTLNFVVNTEKVTGALKDNLANKANVEAGNAGTFEVEFDASNKLVLSTENTAILISEIEFFEEQAISTGVEQPVGGFHGVVKLIAAAGGGLQPVDLTLTEGNATLWINGQAVTVTSVSWDNESKITIVTDGAYGTLTAEYAEDTNAFTVLSVSGTNGAYIDTNNPVVLHGNALFYDCDGTTAELQAVFGRRYYRSNVDAGWVNDTGNADRVSSVSDPAVQGNALKLRPISAGANNRVALTLLNDFAEARPTTTIGYWVYNAGASDVTLRAWGYPVTGKASNFEYVNIDGSGSMVAKAGQWTYIMMTFYSGGVAQQKNIYNFQIADMNSTQGETLYFDNICLL